MDSINNRPNSYELALQSVGEIIKQYGSSGMFPAFGFGAKINQIVSHHFPLNGNENHPYCSSLEELLNFYRDNVRKVTLWGPTNFSPVINSTASIANQYQDGGRHYFILLIITDGIITDQLQTKRAIINHASESPLSIVIVGVGEADFSAMDELDADEVPLTADGKILQRDIVQFVPMNRFLSKGGSHIQAKYQLAQELLYEVPDQITSYMKHKGFRPATKSD